jgi:hypothetical protein
VTRLFIAALTVFAGACQSPTSQIGPTISRGEEFFPDKWQDKQVTLRLASLEVDAEATLTKSGTRRKLTIVRDGTVLEEEVYDVTTEGIGVVALGSGEQFSPPIPLLAFPMQVGQSFEWKGDLLLATREIRSNADVATERSVIDIASGTTETVLSTVTLRMQDDSGRPAIRKLRFWFAKGRGIIKRDYGNQVREPRAGK